MLKEFTLYPATVNIKDGALLIVSEPKILRLTTAWLKLWQQRFEEKWSSVLSSLQTKGLMQIMLEGESAWLLLPLVLSQATPFNKHVLYSDNVYLSAANWEQIECFYQQSGVESEQINAVFAWLRNYWPLALPGVHRLDAEDASYSLTLGLGEPSYLQQQWLCSIDVFVRDEAKEQRSWPWVLRYAAAHCHFLMESSIFERDDFQAAAKKAGMRLEGASGSRPHLEPSVRGESQLGTKKRTMAIVGGGIAGAGIAGVMHQRGWQVTVFDPAFAESNAARHKNHIAAAMTPFISVDDNHKSRLSRNAILRALHHWRDFPDEVMVSRSGNLEVNRDHGYGKDITLAVETLAFPEQWVRRLSPSEVSDLLGFELPDEGIFWPKARLISPEKLLAHLYQHFPVQQRDALISRIQKRQSDGDWALYGQDGELLGQFHQVVLANAADCLAILEKSDLMQRTNVAGEVRAAMPKIEATMHWMGGEVMHVPANRLKHVPQVALGGQGYFLPPVAQGECVLGSTYRHGVRDPGLSVEGQAVIKEKIPVPLDELDSSTELESGWSGGRAVVQGRLPVICELEYARGCWLAVAYGSHGLTWSSFAGDIIGTTLDGEPVPLEKELVKALGLR
ncbi:MAG: FAD-dependent oxidoreductase [Alcaligenaceae bacterium]|nr:FAD-dependent oxidoreductase [Alcaligenaceae bacterium]